MNKESIVKRLKTIYSYNCNVDVEKLYERINLLLMKYEKSEKSRISEKDVMLITYGDSLNDNERHFLKV